MRADPNLRRRLAAGILLLGAAPLLAGLRRPQHPVGRGGARRGRPGARRSSGRDPKLRASSRRPSRRWRAPKAPSRRALPRSSSTTSPIAPGGAAAIAVTAAEERTALAGIEQLTAEQDRLMLDQREREIQSLQAELAALQAQQTDRGLVVTLGDILFDFDEAELTPGGELQVARLADALRQMPDRNVLIEGHTDSSGSDAYNLELSQRRANAVEDLLIVQGVDPTRVLTRGYGEQYPGRRQRQRGRPPAEPPRRGGDPRAGRGRRAAQLSAAPAQRWAPGTQRTSPAPSIVEVAREHEQVVREAVEVLDRDRAHRLAPGELDGQPLGAPHHGARLVEERRGRPPARQDERAQRFEPDVMPSISSSRRCTWSRLDAQHVSLRRVRAGAAEIGAEVEEIVLDARQHRVAAVSVCSRASPITALASSTVP